MKPDSIVPNIKTEQLPVKNGLSAESSLIFNNPEFGLSNSVERGVSAVEPNVSASDVSAMVSLPAPIADDNTTSDPVVSGVPLIAKDDDLIEKEWVDKAKQIVNQTKNDPHQQEKKVSKLKVDYLKKRFGREIGSAE